MLYQRISFQCEDRDLSLVQNLTSVFLYSTIVSVFGKTCHDVFSVEINCCLCCVLTRMWIFGMLLSKSDFVLKCGFFISTNPRGWYMSLGSFIRPSGEAASHGSSNAIDNPLLFTVKPGCP